MAGGASVVPAVDAMVPPDGRCGLSYDPGYTCSSAPPSDGVAFDPSLGKCVTVAYNGCGGLMPFINLTECEVLCERKVSDPSCPVAYSDGAACATEGAICSYSNQRWLCTIGGLGSCAIADSRCGANSNAEPAAPTPCNGDVCSIQQADIILVGLYTCVCTSGAWNCTTINI